MERYIKEYANAKIKSLELYKCDEVDKEQVKQKIQCVLHARQQGLITPDEAMRYILQSTDE